MSDKHAASWSEPNCGVTHLGQVGDLRRASIQEYGSFATLLKWFKGCGFNPLTQDFDTVDEAKRAGDAWIKNGI